MPRDGSEDGGLATIRRPLDVTPQGGDDRRGAGPAQNRRLGIRDQIGARSAGRMMCRTDACWRGAEPTASTAAPAPNATAITVAAVESKSSTIGPA